MFARSIVTGLAFTVLIVGCSNEEKAEAEQLATQYFEAVKSNDVDSVMLLYSSEFFDSTPEQKWRAVLASCRTKLGETQSYELENWHVKTMLGVGTTVVLFYRVKYSKYDGTETIRAYRDSGDERFLINGHSINSEGLVLE